MKARNKVVACLLPVVLAMTMGMAAMAAEPTDVSTVTMEKHYNLTNEGTSSPEETFSFSVVSTGVTDAGANVDKDNIPLPTVDSVAYSKGEAGSATAVKDLTITLPAIGEGGYTGVGVYTYKITENQPAKPTAGVAYFDNEILLKVYVIEGEKGQLRVAGVNTQEEAGTKTTSITNEYSAGNLTVTKKVTGNLGDKDKYFEITVTLKGDENLNYEDSYPVEKTSNESNPTAIKVGEATTFLLKDGESINISNLPYGVTYMVTEADYSAEQYKEAVFTYTDEQKTIDSLSDTVTVTNTKNGDIDTGITLDSLPYLLILAGVACVAFVMVTRRRRVDD